ncbi:unnamed protein product [Effrenium voratum]|nr:unnamed protein product [Effrenium voratum]
MFEQALGGHAKIPALQLEGPRLPTSAEWRRGGIQLVMVNPVCSLLDDRPGPNVISSFLCFCVFAMLATVALGPAQQAIQLHTVEDVMDAHICDWPAWSDTGGGVYFRDGSVLAPGSDRTEPVTEVIIPHCEWLSVRHQASGTSRPPGRRAMAEPVFLQIDVEGKLSNGAAFCKLELPIPLQVLQTDEALDAKSVDQRSGVLLWEAALDLGRFLARMPAPASEGLSVLELGCGHGVPGLVAAKAWKTEVTFHDMSIETLREVTAVNCAANSVGEAHFLAGDWKTLLRQVQEASLCYDVMLASEAIYKEDSYDDLLAIFSLAQCAYVAGKRFYFGCGGGTEFHAEDSIQTQLAPNGTEASFARAAEAKGFEVSTAEVLEDLRSISGLQLQDGRSNIREILRLTPKSPPDSGSAKRAKRRAARRWDLTPDVRAVGRGEVLMNVTLPVLRQSPNREEGHQLGWVSSSWKPCALLLQPVLRCSQDLPRCRDVCAWAIVSPERTLPRCHHGSRSICGLALSLMRITQSRCAGPDARDRFCSQANRELASQLDELAQNLSLSTCWGEWDINSARMAPLLDLVEPQEVREIWDQSLWLFLLLSILYLPAPLLAAYCMLSRRSQEWPVLEMLGCAPSAWAREEDRYIAVD